MSNGPITWENIPGLTDEERRLGASAFQVDDLSTVTLRNSKIDGTLLPDIVNGVVQR